MKKLPKAAGRKFPEVPVKQKGRAGETAGQSGDTQGLSDDAEAGPESVAELVEEGQALEAEVIEAVENAPGPDEGEVRTKEVPEDDVPPEYLNANEKD